MGKTKKQRVNLFLDPVIVKSTKFQAVAENVSLSDLVEKALRDYTPQDMGVERSKDNSLKYVSGPTISTMQPDQRGFGVPTFEESLDKRPIADNRGVQPQR